MKDRSPRKKIKIKQGLKKSLTLLVSCLSNLITILRDVTVLTDNIYLFSIFLLARKLLNLD
jgi:hypothetical protein